MYELVTPCSLGYDSARLLWNRAFDPYPNAISYCRCLDDVQNAVQNAIKNDQRIRVRSGGHNYEGFSSETYTYVIDVSQMNQITMNLSEQTVTIEAGAKNAAIYHFLATLGYPFPGGTCPSVSISGFTLGGGWGYSARKYGLGIDSLCQLELVDYEGKRIIANEMLHPDLFWACRGAGAQNFGVVTRYKFQLPKIKESALLFILTVPNASLEDQIQFLDTWQKFIPTADRNINMNGGIYHSVENGYYNYLRGFYYGTAEQLELVVQPFTNLPGCILTVYEETMIQSIDRVFSSYEAYEYFKSGGRFVTTSYPLSTLTTLAQILRSPLPEGSLLASINVFGLGGAVADVDSADTAYFYRNSSYILQVQSVFGSNEYRTQNVDWVVAQYKYIQTITAGSYVNFPFTPLDDYMTAYYGDNRYRLYDIKKKYDPCNYFNYAQSIPVYENHKCKD